MGEMRQVLFRPSDGTESCKMFNYCCNNRFLTPKAANKNRLNLSGRMLYFFDVPTDFTEAMFNEVSSVSVSRYNNSYFIVSRSFWTCKAGRSQGV
jgi:hypothetical protein